jgi:hypothetical protein
MNQRHMIIDDKGVVWSSDEYDAFEEGSALIAAVTDGDIERYKDALGETWTGDLVLVKELARTR